MQGWKMRDQRDQRTDRHGWKMMHQISRVGKNTAKFRIKNAGLENAAELVTL